MDIGILTVLLPVICTVFIIISCFVCPCCLCYKMCRRPTPVIATTTHTTVVTSVPQQYPQQPTAAPGPPQSYQWGQYPAYHPVPMQTHLGQPSAGPPPTYQEAIGPGYPPHPMPYSQAAFSPGQPAYPLQPPALQYQPNAPPANRDFLSQPAYNPDYVPSSMSG
ncbi:protein shisa-5-like [Mugil cephalus]|uniref:protein shisa-5-like n=1 Tax=Mugil cephalus TaxID=48193 RepID=UPI001FB7F001|nr:protein shisa-5-like [Mugil cephalus]